MKVRSVKVNEHEMIRVVKVQIQKRDLVKIFTTVVAAEMVSHFPVRYFQKESMQKAAEKFIHGKTAGN